MSDMRQDAWFVRRGSGLCTNIRPARIEGWLFSAGYAAGIVFLAALVEKRPEQLLVWATLIVTSTILYTVACYRLSVPDGGRGKC